MAALDAQRWLEEQRHRPEVAAASVDARLRPHLPLPSRGVTTRWLDLVDPNRDELLSTLPGAVDPEVVEILAERPAEGRAPWPVLESHGAYVFGVLMAARPLPDEDRIAYQEVDLVATPGALVTVRKTSRQGDPPFDVSALHPAAEHGVSVGRLVQRLVDEVANSFLDSLDTSYAEIEELEDALDTLPASRVRMRLSDLRHELLRARRLVAATRAAVRRVLDGRIEVVGNHALFPADVERLFSDTYDTLVRATEELDIAREHVAGVRDHHQSKVVESQGEVAKKLTVIASLVLVPSFIVGFYGQNFAGAFDDAYWSIAVFDRPHRRLDARPARDLPLAPLDLSRLEGHRSSTTHASQRGRRASQMRRPCQMRRCGKRAQSARGTTRWRSRSILTGSSFRVRPSRCESRRTCVSTTMPCACPSSAATTFAVLRATPGNFTSSARRRGTSPSYSSMSIRIVPRIAFAFCRKNPVA